MLFSIAVLATACERDKHVNRPHAAFLFPGADQYSVVILKKSFMERAFGSGWQVRRLYYGYSGGFSDGVELRTRPEPLSMLSVHPPVMLIAGSRWNRDLSVLIYDSESNEQVLVAVDMVEAEIRLKTSLRKRQGRAAEHFLKDGRLVFRDQ